METPGVEERSDTERAKVVTRALISRRWLFLAVIFFLGLFLHLSYPRHLPLYGSSVPDFPRRLSKNSCGTDGVHVTGVAGNETRARMLRENAARLSYWVDLRRYFDSTTYEAFFPDATNDLSQDALAVGWLGYFVSLPFGAIAFFVLKMWPTLIVFIWMWFRWTECHTDAPEGRQPPVEQEDTPVSNYLYIAAGYCVLSGAWIMATRTSWNVLFPEHASLPLNIAAILACIPGTVWLWKTVRQAG
ncbi:uncharacterized protein LOC129599247 [Paramacrobiotus metropolitanus]|uniref:uncharacterized protein LOC129599247 n=1 Tax=Paramacrobiotus metropolitanus TaxID=2943436 RepID=UPI002445808F|nr:uncharacterized protein LOC129599247 [Paramacrobiotus metropolitanus]